MPGIRPRAANPGNATAPPVVDDAGDGVIVLRFNRPAKAIVGTGSDRVFAAGGDLKEWQDKEPLDLWSSKRNEYRRTFNQFSKPLIAAVNGYTYGGGCEFVLQADIAVCGESARFRLPEITLGFVPGRGGTQRLPILTGRSAASYMILTGEPIPEPMRIASAGCAAIRSTMDGRPRSWTVESASLAIDRSDSVSASAVPRIDVTPIPAGSGR